ncbi:headcase protein-like [Dreissena polymorpha]|uniref:Headcase middle domain-containing protein n=1 Tax=Dreissena polymorpha TaxID=45954 RepID=A0A9D4S2D7_DREPO|nr:headcase protein-like [Dreissena polymorpha]KAH3889291.1 hypothetical protein DPMN_013344 [Dreissena polymorpha]
MPHQKHGKNARQHGARADANNNVQDHAPVVNNNGGQPQPHGHGQRMQKCCAPGVCPVKEELIDTDDIHDEVRVVCNNEACDLGNWMHKSCFDGFEESVLSYLRSCGRARSWSEKQRLQNLWTKKGYDLAFKACDCNCAKGHLRKDLDYIPPVRNDNAGKKKSKKKSSTDTAKPALNNGVHVGAHVPPPASVARERRPSGNNNTNMNHNTTAPKPLPRKVDNADKNGNAVLHESKNGVVSHIRKTSPSITILNNRNVNDDRLRANSISSTGSSPPNSASSTSGSNSPVPLQTTSTQRTALKSKFEFTEHVPSPSSSPANGLTAANLFRKRMDLSAFSMLPKHKQNPYHIKMEDDGLAGVDEVHSFVLNHLSNCKISTLNCVLCKNELCIFEKYPLIDGTLFLSPQAYDSRAIQAISEGRLQYINAVCVTCLEGANDIRCAACKHRWDGSSLLLGSMYSYDIFAAMPCCQKRLTCKHCRRAVVDVSCGLPYFSEYSHMIPCPYCRAYDYHFIRPLSETFAIKMSIWH